MVHYERPTSRAATMMCLMILCFCVSSVPSVQSFSTPPPRIMQPQLRTQTPAPLQRKASSSFGTRLSKFRWDRRDGGKEGILSRAWKRVRGSPRVPQTHTGRQTGRRRRQGLLWTVVPALLLAQWLGSPRVALAMAVGGGSKGPVAPMRQNELAYLISLWAGLFTVLALLHAAEIAITTLYPWKVREFAEDEEKQRQASGAGGRGTFQVLNEDITRVLTTILVTSTACSIFATTIFTHLAASIFGVRGERYGAVALTAVTLFFVELLPKSIGVTNAESVARLIVPPINMVSIVVSPLGGALSWLAKKTVRLLGFKAKDEGGSVSDSELRLIVTGARDSGTIDHGEQEMIKGVLNLQDQRVREIMKPRVEIVAVPKEMSVASVLGVVRESGYSRIPVYDGEIDNIVGIVLAKSVLDFFVRGVLVDGPMKKPNRPDADTDVNGNTDANGDTEPPLTEQQQKDMGKLYSFRTNVGEAADAYVRGLTGAELASRMETSISDADLVESTYFVPDTANGWAVLEEMRRRRVHMAVVVDEYGGTEGLVSLEDIIEEVVGEIYDEDDETDFEFSEDSITLQEDGTFLIRGDADLGDCDTILGLTLDEEETLKEFGTMSGFLCMCAGEIPQTGDFVMSRGWSFEVIDADSKRILNVKVERLTGFYDDEKDDKEDNAFLGFLKKRENKKLDIEGENNNGHSSSSDDGDNIVDAELLGMGGTTTEVNGNGSSVTSASDFDQDVIIRQNIEEAEKIERMVEGNQKTRSYVKEMMDADMQQQQSPPI
eukprot:scaffold50815_cov40-Attheya_sp.AAC.1